MNVHSLSNRSKNNALAATSPSTFTPMPRPKQIGVDWNTRFISRFPVTSRCLIGVSGGRDSVALLHWLLSLGYRKLVVCHLDHKLRGRASRSDAAFVRQMARRHGLQCEIGNADVRLLAARTRQSIETAGRTARYEFFARTARRRRCRAVFLAHHADDLVETFLMNLFRGAGPAGFGGMREIVARKVSGVDLQIIRPFLSIWRDEINAYVKANRLEFREDSTNQTLGPARNRVRRRIIPYIEKQLGREVRGALWRAATISADEAEWLEGQVDPKQTEAAELSVAHLRSQPRAAQRRIIQKWLRTRGVEDLDFETIERVRALLEPETKIAKTNLPGDLHARRRAGKIFLE
jgi:tRNA(Ile)-lysidine synthase